MSLYTKVSSTELAAFLQHYTVGKLVNHQGIEAGVTNTNYWLNTDQGQYVLTLYEHSDNSHLKYILRLQRHLAHQGVACATPIIDKQARLYSPLNGRPAAIIKRVAGNDCIEPNIHQCHQIGAELARFHQAGLSFEAHQPNTRGIDWWVSMSSKLHHVLAKADTQLIAAVIREYQALEHTKLPQGALHGDLFRDNALFDGENLSGIIDFDYACNDHLVYDIAVTINDWCIDPQGLLITAKLDALIGAYDQIRRLQDYEYDAMPVMLQVAALRFWLSRLHDKTFPLEGELVFIKDPDECRQMLLTRRQTPPSFTDTKARKNSAE